MSNPILRLKCSGCRKAFEVGQWDVKTLRNEVWCTWDCLAIHRPPTDQEIYEASAYSLDGDSF